MDEDKKVKVTFSNSDHELMLKETFVEPQAFGFGVVKGKNITFELTEDDIDYIHGYIAAAISRAESSGVQRKLERILNKLSTFLGY